VLYAARSACSPSWEWKNPDGHQDKLNFWLIVDGVGSWQGGGRTYPLAAGDCFVQRLWQPCHGTTDPERPLVVLWANCTLVRPDGSAVVLAQLTEARLPALHRRYASPHFIASLAQRMIDRFESEGVGPATDQWLACIWDELGVGARSGADDGQLAELIGQVRAHPERPWRVAGLAQALGMPVDRFTRRFHAHTGVPPRLFLVRARLEAAKALLRMSNDSIAAIASRLGFCDIYHFSRRFRQHVGCAPSAYRSGSG
jgi:AraC-like DNA-binding protein